MKLPIFLNNPIKNKIDFKMGHEKREVKEDERHKN